MDVRSKQEEFMQVYEPLHGRFERYCKTRCNGNALFRDVMHDTLLIAFEKFESIQSREAFLHFLFGTASRVLANQRRKKKPEFVEDFAERFRHLPEDTNNAERALEIQQLYEQLNLLDDTTRECLILFEISGFSIREIMDILNLSESTVKQRLSRGRKQLLERMMALETNP